jgi:hypothetical protein
MKNNFPTISYLESLQLQMRDLGVHLVEISDVSFLYFQIYSLWKLGFLNSLEISFK